MAGMVVSAATGEFTSLLSELSDLFTDLYKQRKGVRRDIEFLCSEWTDMNGALEKLAGMEKLDISKQRCGETRFARWPTISRTVLTSSCML